MADKPEPNEKLLSDVKIRADFYEELLLDWGFVLDRLKKSYAQYPNEKDKTRLLLYASAISLVEEERDKMTARAADGVNYDNGKWTLRKMLDDVKLPDSFVRFAKTGKKDEKKDDEKKGAQADRKESTGDGDGLSEVGT